MPHLEGVSVLEAVRVIQKAATPPETVRQLASFAGRYNADEIYLGELGGMAAAFNRRIPGRRSWLAPYRSVARDYDETLALLRPEGVRLALSAREPIRWGEFCARSAPSAAGAQSAADGLLFPAHAVDRPSGCISVGSSGKGAFCFDQVGELEIVCQTAYNHLASFGRVFPFRKVARRAGRWKVLGVPGAC